MEVGGALVEGANGSWGGYDQDTLNTCGAVKVQAESHPHPRPKFL